MRMLLRDLALGHPVAERATCHKREGREGGDEDSGLHDCVEVVDIVIVDVQYSEMCQDMFKQALSKQRFRPASKE